MTTLADEIADDPAGMGYAQHLPDCPGLVVDLLNARTQMAPQSRMVTARGILADVAGGAAILDKLEAVGAQVPEVRWAMKFMVGDQGIDIGHPRTRGLVQALGAQGVLTQGEADALLALAVQPCSRADLIGLPTVTEADLRSAGVI
jgi:hypothetical protein